MDDLSPPPATLPAINTTGVDAPALLEDRHRRALIWVVLGWRERGCRKATRSRLAGRAWMRPTRFTFPRRSRRSNRETNGIVAEAAPTRGRPPPGAAERRAATVRATRLAVSVRLLVSEEAPGREGRHGVDAGGFAGRGRSARSVPSHGPLEGVSAPSPSRRRVSKSRGPLPGCVLSDPPRRSDRASSRLRSSAAGHGDSRTRAFAAGGRPAPCDHREHAGRGRARRCGRRRRPRFGEGGRHGFSTPLSPHEPARPRPRSAECGRLPRRRHPTAAATRVLRQGVSRCGAPPCCRVRRVSNRSVKACAETALPLAARWRPARPSRRRGRRTTATGAAGRRPPSARRTVRPEGDWPRR